MDPCCRVQSEASKFPLSTEETNWGANGGRVRVSYQFRTCPPCFFRLDTVANVLRDCAANSGTVRYPNSEATCRALRRKPSRDCGRLLLNVVRYQPVVLGGAVLGKISPGFQSRAAKECYVLRRSLRTPRGRRTIKPSGNPLAASPQ